MNIKNLLNNPKTYQAKTFLLAGLIGLMFSCKTDKNAPDTPSTQNRTYSGQNDPLGAPKASVDSFMIHMPNVANAVFYEPMEDTHYFLFRTDPMTHSVNRISEIRDAKNNNRCITNTYELIRCDNTCVNGSANFITGPNWFYEVKYDIEGGQGGNWSIECVSEEDYNNTYRNMPNDTLANIAKNRILETHPGEAWHAEQIYNAILNRQGHWRQEDQFFITFNSKGAQQNLKYSDFGTFYVTTESTNDYWEPFTSMYSGGLKDNEVGKFFVPSQTFNATAFGNVRYDNRNGSEILMVISTDRDSAKYTVDEAQNETIVMPFNNWYKVTIIRTNNSVISKLEDAFGNIAQQWQVPHPNTTENQYREGVQDNGLYAKDGFSGTLHQDGILTGTSVNYYTDETGYTEFVGQGYRQDWSQNKKIQFTFCFGGTNRPKPEEQITTGLDNVYCAPARQR